MLKKVLGALILTLALIAIVGYFRFFAPATGFSANQKIIYIPSNNASISKLLEVLTVDTIVKNPNHFAWMARQLKYTENIKPGRYKISSGMSVTEIIRMLRNGNQFPSRLVINNLRLPEDLAKLLGKTLETDSASALAFITNKDSMALLGLKIENWSANIIPDTYEVLWTWSVEKTMKKLVDNRQKWWNKSNRTALAEAKGLSPDQVHIIASIVEEETNKKEDKPLIASVYLNRLNRGMPLQADPTIRFAIRDFKINRVLFSHLRTPSPYNTYINRGLPPGPICTATPSSLDAVLNAPKTDYIFFVANADLRGGSTFTTNLADHNKAARLYQDSLTAWQGRNAAREITPKDSVNKPGKPANP